MLFVESELMQDLLVDSLQSFDMGDVYRAKCKLDEAEKMEVYLFRAQNSYAQIFSEDNVYEALEEIEEAEKWERLLNTN